MHFEVRIEANDSEGELRSLNEWLLDEPEIRRTARIARHSSPPRPGEMGALVDTLHLITDNLWSSLSFATALAAWRRTRPANTQITIRRGSVEITIPSTETAAVEEVLRFLEQDGEREE